MSFKLKNLSTAANHRIVLTPIGDATFAPLEAYADKIVMENGEVKFCLTPKTIINCAGAENETSVFTIDGQWEVEVDGVGSPGDLTTLEMIEFLRSQGLEVVIVEDPTPPVLADDAFFMSVPDASRWEVELDGVSYIIDGVLQSGALPTELQSVLQFEYDYFGLYVRNLSNQSHDVRIQPLEYPQTIVFAGDQVLNPTITQVGDWVQFTVAPKNAPTPEDDMVLNLSVIEGDKIYFEIIPTENHNSTIPGSTTTVEWGDGTTTDLQWDTQDNYYYVEHAYPSPGEYTMRIRSSIKLDYLMIGNVKDIVQWGKKIASGFYFNFSWSDPTLSTVPTTLANWMVTFKNMFRGLTDTSVLENTVTWDTQWIRYFDGTFMDCTAVTADLSGWNTSRGTNFKNMFNRVGNISCGIGNWDMSSAGNMSAMFREAGPIADDISGWDVRKASDMSTMFYNNPTFNQNISGWAPIYVTNMSTMFYGATAFNQNLTQWCVPMIGSLPTSFANNAPLFTPDKYPVWGTCPRGENEV